jgi:ankyrin repeat protein
LDAGTDANIQDCETGTPLHIAVEYGYVECVKVLVDHFDNMKCLQELLKVTTNINHQNNQGWTALHFACSHG